MPFSAMILNLRGNSPFPVQSALTAPFFKGEISTKGTLIVGETANIEAEIHASHIIISGEVRGSIVAENKIEAHAPGKIIGNIQAPTITIDEGVVFEGNCRMQKQGEESEEDKKVTVLPQSAGSKE